jgi:hypothetical protein
MSGGSPCRQSVAGAWWLPNNEHACLTQAAQAARPALGKQATPNCQSRLPKACSVPDCHPTGQAHAQTEHHTLRSLLMGEDATPSCWCSSWPETAVHVTGQLAAHMTCCAQAQQHFWHATESRKHTLPALDEQQRCALHALTLALTYAFWPIHYSN